MKLIPFNRPDVDYRVLEYIKEVIDEGKLSGDGPMGRKVESQLQALFSLRHALLTTSGTHALEIAVQLLRLERGDEVIVPSFTFVSTANAVLRGGGCPVFCDINHETLTMDVTDFERRITKRSKGVIAVHYAGVAAEMDKIMAIARQHNLVVIEDAAQGVNARYNGHYLGTIGHCGTYSFHDTKNYISGEGGAFVTNDEDFARRAEIIREKGTNRANFLRGEVDKYTWIDQGSSYILSDVLAAILKSQLDDLGRIQERRREIHYRYVSGLEDLQEKGRLRLPVIPAGCESNFHIFYILLQNGDDRNRIMKSLKDRNIQTTFHYVPLHSSPFARRFLGTSSLSLPNTDRLSASLLRLPIYPQLSDAEVDYVIEQLHDVVM